MDALNEKNAQDQDSWSRTGIKFLFTWEIDQFNERYKKMIFGEVSSNLLLYIIYNLLLKAIASFCLESQAFSLSKDQMIRRLGGC